MQGTGYFHETLGIQLSAEGQLRVVLRLDKSDGPQMRHAHRLHVDAVDILSEAFVQTGKRAMAGMHSNCCPARYRLANPRLAGAYSPCQGRGSRAPVDEMLMIA